MLWSHCVFVMCLREIYIIRQKKYSNLLIVNFLKSILQKQEKTLKILLK